MIKLSVGLLSVLLAGCGQQGDSSEQAAHGNAENQRASITAKPERRRTGGIGSAQDGVDACAYLESGILQKVFSAPAEGINHRGSIPSKRAGHVVCSASWNKPEQEQLEAAYKQAVLDWSKGVASGGGKPRPSYPKTSNEVSVTLVGLEFDSAQDAIAELESTVATLKQGVTFKVAGKERTRQTNFGNWVEGVGDKAIFTDKGTLFVTYDARRITVAVSVTEDPELKKEKSIEFAQALMGN